VQSLLLLCKVCCCYIKAAPAVQSLLLVV
jgi:hypothetical protein